LGSFRIQIDAPERVAAFTSPMTSAFKIAVIGEIAGIMLGGIVYL
jgi:hypothetical protein